jgi:hypothetical protein
MIGDKKKKQKILFAARLYMKSQEARTDVQKLAALEMFSKFPDDIKRKARVAAQARMVPGVVRAPGRRTALKEMEAQTGVRIHTIKVSIAGSGFGKWRTEQDRDKCVPEDAEARGWSKVDSPVTSFSRNTGKGPELMFAGPGGAGTGGFNPKGALDRGSNSIDNLVAEVPRQIDEIIEGFQADPDDQIVVLMRAHSRGAVAADMIANALKLKYKNLTFELVVFDPVMGPSQKGEKVQTDIGNIDSSTLIMSVNPGKNVLNEQFTSQKVLGAKRIILSTQDHSAGVEEGFIYEGKRYRGSAINSLPEGIFIDRNGKGQSKVPLDLVADMDKMRSAVDALEAKQPGSGDLVKEDAYAFAAKEVRTSQQMVGSDKIGNTRRSQIIDEVLRSYLNRV